MYTLLKLLFLDRCKEGYSGRRCEINICRGYCLNSGACTVDDKLMPICKCQPGHEGSRCETDVRATTTSKNVESTTSTVTEIAKTYNTSDLPRIPSTSSDNCK